MLDPKTLDELRNLILLKVGISIISPSDCQHIAISIYKELNKTISKTTLKRLFGFAVVNHNFSKFTINTLLEFVNHPYLKEVNKVTNDDAIGELGTAEWLKISSVAKQLTQSTLKHIATKCKIPFEYTINRKFAQEEFDYFYESNFNFTSFVSQPGNGKSILLAHLVTNLSLKEKYENDILLFINASDLFTADDDNQDLDGELKRVLRISNKQTIIKLFNEFHQKTGRKIVIIIDAFYYLFSFKKDKSAVFESIIYWLCEIEESKAIKVIVSMRSYLWQRFHSLIRNSHYLKKKWYPGKNYNEQYLSNVPKLTKNEVDSILNNIEDKSANNINTLLKSKLRHPFYFKYHYILKNEYRDFHNTDIEFYEIYLRFILQRIYRSNLITEKLIVCEKIIQFSDYGLKLDKVDKTMFLHDFFMFKQAYMELLAEGIIIEDKQIINGLLSETVGFVHQHFFDYFLFKELSKKELNSSNHNAINQIKLNYSKKRATSLIKWSIFTKIKDSNYKFIGFFSKKDLEENKDIRLFLIENIKYQLKSKPQDLIELKKTMKEQYLIEYHII